MAAERRAEATWRGDLLSGEGTIDGSGAGAFGPPRVSWAARTEDPTGRHEPGGADRRGARLVLLDGALERARQGREPARRAQDLRVGHVRGRGHGSSSRADVSRVPGLDEAASSRRPRTRRRAARSRRRWACPRSRSTRGSRLAEHRNEQPPPGEARRPVERERVAAGDEREVSSAQTSRRWPTPPRRRATSTSRRRRRAGRAPARCADEAGRSSRFAVASTWSSRPSTRRKSACCGLLRLGVRCARGRWQRPRAAGRC